MGKRSQQRVAWACVFKVTFPNQKIYIGSDTAKNAREDFFKYFGSPSKGKAAMLSELGEYLDGKVAYTLSKEILYAQENVSVGEILAKEQYFINQYRAKDPSVGYNR